MENFSHILEVDEKEKKLCLYRLFDDGSKQLYTNVDLPAAPAVDNREQFEAFAIRLTENLLIDSPQARKLLKL